MAIRFDSTDRLSRTTNLPSEASITFACCGRRQVDRGGYGCFVEMVNGAAGAGIFVGFDGSGDNIIVNNYIADSSTIITPGTGNWFFAALTQNGTGAGNLIGYAALHTSASLSSQTHTGVSFTEATLNIGNNAGGDLFNGDLAFVKIWTAVLTSAELEAERWSAWPVRWANLHAFYPLLDVNSRTFDYTSNGYTMTSAGTLTQADNPPVAIAPFFWPGGWRGAFTASGVAGPTTDQLWPAFAQLQNRGNAMIGRRYV